MGDRGHRASDGEYEIWATVMTGAPLDVLTAHLVEPQHLRRWVPCAKKVVAEGEDLRMEILFSTRIGPWIYTGRTLVRSSTCVERSWELVRPTVRPRGRPAEPAAYQRDLRYDLADEAGTSRITARATTRIPGARVRALDAGGKAEAKALAAALGDLVHLAGSGRRGPLRRLRAATTPAGPL